MATIDRAVDAMLAAIQPAEIIKHDAAIRRVVDPAEGINPASLAPHLAPLVLRWGPSDTGRWPTARSGTAVMYRACAETPPSGGACVITLTILTEFSGEETIGTVSIPKGQQFGASALVYVLPAGSWLASTVTTANGASGVSSALTIKGDL